jgi:hypothetical protein
MPAKRTTKKTTRKTTKKVARKTSKVTKKSPAKRTPAKKASPAKRTPARSSPAKRTPARSSPVSPAVKATGASRRKLVDWLMALPKDTIVRVASDEGLEFREDGKDTKLSLLNKLYTQGDHAVLRVYNKYKHML